MSIIKAFNISLIIMLFAAMGLNAQERPAYGIFGDLNLNFHTVDFRKLIDVPCCSPFFDKGDGIGFSIGALYSHPINKILNIEIRLGYFTRDGKLKKTEYKIVNYTGEAIQGEFEHTIDTKLSSIALEPVFGIKFFDEFRLKIGLHAGLTVKNTFDQVETLVKPDTGFYENFDRKRLDTTGDLKSPSAVEFAFLTGISYTFALDKDKTWFLEPEIMFALGLNNVTSDLIWKVNQLRFGLALMYSPLPEKVIPKYEPEKVLPLGANIDAVGVLDDTLELPVVRFKVEEYLSHKLKPLLTYVFFDENSSEIPKRYKLMTKDATKNFTIERLHKMDAMEAYYHILNIIGSRMVQYPDAKITIDGCNSDSKSEKNNLALSEKRAQTVRDYLVNIWSIDDSRIATGKRNLPQLASNQTERDGIEENRRAEITANRWEIIAPIATSDTTYAVNPPVLRFKPSVHAEKGLASWKIIAQQKGEIINQFRGAGNPPETIDWRFESNEKSVPYRSDVVDYRLTATDVFGKAVETELKSIPVDKVTIQQKRRERVADKYLDRYSLMLFGFDKAELSYYNSLVVDIIKKNMTEKSTMHFTGYTDRTGDANYNKKLSRERAQLAADQFKDNKSFIRGYGEDEYVFDNDLPEGRFYSRRVDITVETPIE